MYAQAESMLEKAKEMQQNIPNYFRDNKYYLFSPIERIFFAFLFNQTIMAFCGGYKWYFTAQAVNFQ